MQIQKICNPKLSKNTSTREKRNQPNFSGNLYLIEHGLESIAEINKFKRLVESITYSDLDVFVWKMPKSEANTVKVRQFQKPSVEKLENYKIMYHDNRTHSIKLSGIYLEPNTKFNNRIAKKNNGKLFDNLVANAMDSLNDSAKDIEAF